MNSAPIEGQAARIAAIEATEREIRELTTLHLALVEATEEDDINRYVDCDREFYSCLSRAAQNIYLGEVIRGYLICISVCVYNFGTFSWHDIARAHEEMTKDVVDAISRRNPEEAELAIKIYVHRRHKDIRAFL